MHVTENFGQAAFLNDSEVYAKRRIGMGVIISVIGALLLAGHWLGQVGVLLGGVGVLTGPGFVWGYLRWLKVLPKAQESLKSEPLDVRLEIRIHPSYPHHYTTAWLWPADADKDGRPLARFSSARLSSPRNMAVDKVPAQVYGAPIRGAAVVVACTQGVLAGRIRWSRFGDDRPARPIPAVVRWLFKERTLRLP
jgi:hypothetical protein